MPDHIPHQTDTPDTDEIKEAVVAHADDDLSIEELEAVSGGGSGIGKRNSYNAAQQPWQATID